jgi:hypothetical protein
MTEKQIHSEDVKRNLAAGIGYTYFKFYDSTGFKQVHYPDNWYEVNQWIEDLTANNYHYSLWFCGQDKTPKLVMQTEEVPF